ncbi:MAG: bifunctional oligoribonuclease/PAP phosphatase NrnA [Clostridiaceae bacterium]|nr:bifunctional oligoribonuclease/PAP phosphatase NrnA [Clostridiaceae bacterium]
MKKMENNPLSLVDKNSKVAVIAHVNPDGDSLGSTLGLGLALKKICNQVAIYINDEFPKKYSFLPAYQDIKLYQSEDHAPFDLCFVLDCGDEKRLGYSKRILENSIQVINIDHHISNTNFGHINLIDAKASSTCEMIYSVVKDFKVEFDKDIATCLYTGIVTDTGNFIYDNTTSYTHKIVSELMELEIDINNITYNLYQNRPLNTVKFLGYILNNLHICYDGKLAIIEVKKDLLGEFNLSHSDVDGVINYARDIEGIEVAVLLKEVNMQEVKVGFRSKSHVDVSKVAQNLGGGGHKKASGATIYNGLDEARKKVEEELKRVL